ncbi:MAG: imidazole glycerol phosphate synthase subunit HisH [Planctomycetaceae bacterium]|nr:imidazole glycerol phosphate synthase subunit HisH [Planctomycetaceae bacterium]
MVVIVDYQMGNLRSVQKAFERVGTPATITDNPHEIIAAERLVLPGVGAFPDAMQELRQRDLIPVLKDYVAAGRPLLGICLGMQLLFDCSREFGDHEGLGIIPGTVEPFELPDPFKVPHMGWNLSRVPDTFPDRLVHPIFQHLAQLPRYFYYVHSFYCCPRDVRCVALEADYGGWFAGAVAQGNVVATQFHPEKSQNDGLELLRRFASWTPQTLEPALTHRT